MRFFVTGTAGFIGFHLARRLLVDGHEVVGFDAMTDYYDRRLKEARHEMLSRHNGFEAVVARLEDNDALTHAAERAEPDVIVHLAAQAGVRYSIENPRAYLDSNLVGSFNLISLAARLRPRHLLLASTSSVYGANLEMPFAEADKADLPITHYAATKKGMEAMSHSYAHLADVPTTCFRFFTVYGPWGRPDMALFRFVDAIENGEPIEVYGEGRMKRDFTYIGDLVEAIVRLTDRPPSPGQSASGHGVVDTVSPAAPWRVVNIAGGAPVELGDFIACVEAALGKSANKILLPMQAGDMPATFADHRLLEVLTGYRPSTPIEVGVREFVDWYRAYSAAQGHHDVPDAAPGIRAA